MSFHLAVTIIMIIMVGPKCPAPKIQQSTLVLFPLTKDPGIKISYSHDISILEKAYSVNKWNCCNGTKYRHNSNGHNSNERRNMQLANEGRSIKATEIIQYCVQFIT